MIARALRRCDAATRPQLEQLERCQGSLASALAARRLEAGRVHNASCCGLLALLSQHGDVRTDLLNALGQPELSQCRAASAELRGWVSAHGDGWRRRPPRRAAPRSLEQLQWMEEVGY
jgi:hypothetical protein